MLYQVKAYLKFLLKSANQHGIHSPFVYELTTKCFYNKTKHPEYSILKNYREGLYNASEAIEIKDFGQGSRIFTSNQRKISAIARNAGIPPKRQRLLFRLVRYFNTETVLELGTSLGLATVALALGNPSSKIHTVEGCQNTAKKAQFYFDRFKLKNIRLHPKTFEDYFTEHPSEKYQLVYIDGNHNKEKTLQYFEILLKQASNDSVFIFDDIYWSPQMTEAWRQIIDHPQVTVSIDTFYWGLVFFRKEQSVQHFSIRL